MCSITLILLNVGGKMKNYDDHRSLKKLDDAWKQVHLHGVHDSSRVPTIGNGNSFDFIIFVPDGGSSGWRPPTDQNSFTIISFPDGGSSGWRPPKDQISFIIISVPDGGSSGWRPPKDQNSFTIISVPDGGSSGWRPPKDQNSFIIISVPDGGSSGWRPPKRNSLIISVPDGGSSRWRPPTKLPETGKKKLSCSSRSSEAHIVMSFLFLQRPALAESSSAMGKTTRVIDIWVVVEQHAAGVCCDLLQLLHTTTVLFLVFWVATISSTASCSCNYSATKLITSLILSLIINKHN